MSQLHQALQRTLRPPLPPPRPPPPPNPPLPPVHAPPSPPPKIRLIPLQYIFERIALTRRDLTMYLQFRKRREHYITDNVVNLNETQRRRRWRWRSFWRRS